MKKYKKGPGNSYYEINLDKNGSETSRELFTKGRDKSAGFFMYQNMKQWELEGNILEPESTHSELLEKEQKLKSDLYVSIVEEFKNRITQSDKIATLLAIGDNYLDITVEQLLTYKQDLRSYYNTLSIDSPLDELQNPSWPDKLTEKELL